MDLVCEISIFGVKTVHLRFSLFKEFNGNLFKERVGKNVFVLNCPRLNGFAELIKLGCKRVCGTCCDRLFIADDLLAEFGGDGSGCCTIFALDDALEFLGDHLIAFAADDVEYRLRADDLRRRCYERR